MEIKKTKLKISERGQNMAWFAVVLPMMAFFILGILDYMITTSRVMEVIAVADLSAHAGAQEVKVLPNGAVIIDDQASSVAQQYFSAQAPGYVQITRVACGMVSGRPACSVQARVTPAHILVRGDDITVNATGYLVYGATRGDQ
jgi:hypothetical protein